jgi:excisionase family DNA binding protein
MPLFGDVLPRGAFVLLAFAASIGATVARSRQARLLVGLDVDLPVEHPAAELQELGPDPLAAPAFQGGLADAPASGQLFLIEVSDFHLGLLPNELAGVHEGAVPHASQGAARHGGGMGVNGCRFGCLPGKTLLFRILRLFVYFGYTPSHDAVQSSQEAAMTTLSPTHSLPTAEEVAIARESGRALSAFLQTRAETQQIEIFDDKGASHPVRVPVSALRLLVDVLTEIGEGNAVSIIPIHAELTTQDAADVLNVSRPFLVQLLERGEIPFHKIGTHRRVRYQDVIAYKERIDAERSKALDALAEQAQALKMGYE